MSSNLVAQALAESLARHQTRGLVDTNTGLTDVVVHGRIDLVAVSYDVLAASRDTRKSWSGWFAARAVQHRSNRLREASRRELQERLESDMNDAASAIVRLRLRKFPEDRTFPEEGPTML